MYFSTSSVSDMLWSSAGLLLALLLFVYCWLLWAHRRLLSFPSDLQELVPLWPLLGHCYLIFREIDETMQDILKKVIKMSAQGLKASVVWFGPLPLVIFITDVDDIQTVLSSSSLTDKADELQQFVTGFDSEAGPMNLNLISATLPSWKVIRKHMNPLFHPRNLEHMIPVFNKNSRELVSCLSKHVGQGYVNLNPHTMDTALKTVCNLLFGPEIDIDIESSDFQGLVSVVEKIPDMFMTRLLRVWLRNDTIFRFLYKHELKTLNDCWNNFTNSRIKKVHEISQKKRLNADSLSGKNKEETTDVASEEPLNIVDAYSKMQETHPEYTEADMHTEILTFYCTGTDTVGTTVASCLLILAHFQDIQERLYQDISNVVSPDSDVTLQHLDNLPYLDQVLKETLRWFLVVPFTFRKSQKDVKLSTYTIPAGYTISVSLASVHMNPKIYPQPHKFDPDRFAPDKAVGKDRFSFLPFSAGPRICIAKTYAMQLMKIMLVHVLRKYKLRTDMDVFKLRKRMVVIMVNTDGYTIALENRS